ncbi:RNA binding protein, heterogenous nuclear RNP-K like protein [Metarhizium acridum]|nr:RNA binding protein, heterogenous nuclear RNP-K like protein [Metarhizium acridum]
MSAPQDVLSANGNDIVDHLDQLKMEDRLGPDGEPAPKTDEEYAQAQLTLRAIVSSKEAGVIIGKGGKNVADLRDETGVKAGVSKVVQGVHDRVLTITGECDAISRAYAIVARALLEGAPAMGMGGIVQSNGTHPIKLLISHNQMGTIIGRQGLKIKHIQDVSGVRMVAQKEMLPQSTERIVEVQGTPDGIQRAVWEICKCLVDDWQRGVPALSSTTLLCALKPAPVAWEATTTTVAAEATTVVLGLCAPATEPTSAMVEFDHSAADLILTQPAAGPLHTMRMARRSRLRTSASPQIWLAASSGGPAARSVRSVRRREPAFLLPRRHTMRRVSACSPSWVLLRPMSLLCSCCMRTSRQRRCAEASYKSRSKVLTLPFLCSVSNALLFISVSLCVNELHPNWIWKKLRH